MIKAIPDFHLHTNYCGHAQGSIDEMVEAAIDLGMKEIGFSGHFPYPPDLQDLPENCVIPMEQLPHFIAELNQAQQKYQSQIEILSGMEVDYLPDYLPWTSLNLSNYHLDYAIGSVHILNGIPLDYNQEYLNRLLEQYSNEDLFWETYWETVIKMLHESWISVVGHLDLPRKFLARQFTSHDFTYIHQIMEIVKEKNLAIDVNTSGIIKATDHQIYPSPQILQIAAEKGIDIMMGSDAHRPNEIARFFPEVVELLLSLGFQHYVIFKNRIKHTFLLQN